MIIGISGKMQSGKDTIAKIIQYLTSVNIHIPYNEWIGSEYETVTDWQIVKFADKVKDIVCLIIGCTRNQLEDIDFKNTELGKEWHRNPYCMMCTYPTEISTVVNGICTKCNTTHNIKYEKLTPRKLLQLIGTDVGRVIHPNAWVNATMRDYKNNEYSNAIKNMESQLTREGVIWGADLIAQRSNLAHSTLYILDTYLTLKEELPNWIITDVRFPNELKAIEDKGGFVIRVNRDTPKLIPCPNFYCNKEMRDRAIKDYNAGKIVKMIDNPMYKLGNHESELALDSHNFDYTIANNGTIEELIEMVKLILIYKK